MGITSRTDARVDCSHCGLPVPAGLVVPGKAGQTGEPEQFCCGGCRIVYQTLRSSGLGDDYYALRSRFESSTAAEPGRATGRVYATFDREAFQDEYVTRLTGTDGSADLAEVDLLLEGVRCAACVWLLERLPKVLDGVVAVRLRMRDARVTITYIPSRVALSRIARELDALGYPAHPPGSDEQQQLARRTERGHLIRMGVAAVCAGNAMLVAFALYAGRADGMEESHAAFFRWIGLSLGWLSILWPGRTFLRGAWAAIRTGTGHLDLPIAIALVSGALAGTWNTVTGHGEAYFDSLTVLVFLLLVGRYIQARQQRWASDAVDLTRALTSASCRIVREANTPRESIEEITQGELAVGDIVEVRPGEPFPADGTLVSGQTRMDTALLTGESDAIAVGPGDEVHAGCQNVASVVRMRTVEVGAKSRVGRLMGLVEEGLAHKPPIERLTDRIAGVFVVVVCGLGLANFAIWIVRADLSTAIDNTVALLIVACPCALGLATPLTLAVAVGRAARSGILVKDAAVFERLVKRGRLLLDKTGTLTHGEPRLVSWVGDESLRADVAAVEARSNHPIARALVRDLENDAVAGVRAHDVVEKLDGGLVGTVGARRVRVGSIEHLAGHGHALPSSLAEEARAMEDRGESVIGVACETAGAAAGVVALASLADSPRADAAPVIRELIARGWQPEILSGDVDGAVQRVAAAVGIEAAWGRVEPEAKLARVRALQAAGDVVWMVGDGVNDAAALAAADVGVAVHGGAETSLAAADVYTSRPGLQPLQDLDALSTRTMRTIHQNLALSFTYNAVGITLAMLGLMDPLVAAILMPVSSASVLALALVSLGRSPRRFAVDGRPQASPTWPWTRRARELTTMSIIYIVLPLALALGGAALAAFVWAVRKGQFDDLDTPAIRVALEDDEFAPKD